VSVQGRRFFGAGWGSPGGRAKSSQKRRAARPFWVRRAGPTKGPILNNVGGREKPERAPGAAARPKSPLEPMGAAAFEKEKWLGETQPARGAVLCLAARALGSSEQSQDSFETMPSRNLASAGASFFMDPTKWPGRRACRRPGSHSPP
jgi:hypothetical protein